MSLARYARDLVSRGQPVIELKPNTKEPAKSGWTNGAAFTDPDDAASHFFGSDANMGVRTDNLIVLDVDAHKGGLESLAQLVAEHGDFQDTYIVETQRGGLHIYFLKPPGVSYAGSVEKLGKGLDIKTGANQQVVGPGSQIDGRFYVLKSAHPIAPCPQWFLDRLTQARVKAPNNDKIIVELDTPPAIAKAIAHLASADGAIQDKGGDDHTYEVAAAILVMGLSREVALDLMLDHWNDRCEPRWEHDDLETKVANAWEYRQRPIGYDHPDEVLKREAGGFEAVTLPVEPPLFTPASRWAGKSSAPDPMVVDMYVPRDYVTVIGAAGGRGKSALALQMMVAVASGTDFLGFKVMPGAAAGFFCEDTENAIHKRTAAICRNLGVDLDKIADRLFPTSFLSCTTELWNERDGATKLLERIEAALTTIPDLRLLILDGAADTFSANENDRGQVTRFMRRLTELAERHGIAIVLIMHESKSTADDDVFAFSGSTAWFNKCRSAIKIARVEDHEDRRRLLHLKGTVGGVTRPALCRFKDFTYARLSDELDRAAKCYEVTKELMAKAMAEGKQLSPNKKASNYAGRYLEDAQSGTDFHKDEFALHLQAPTGLGLAIEIYSKSGGRRSQRFAALPVGLGDGSVSVTVGDGR